MAKGTRTKTLGLVGVTAGASALTAAGIFDLSGVVQYGKHALGIDTSSDKVEPLGPAAPTQKLPADPPPVGSAPVLVKPGVLAGVPKWALIAAAAVAVYLVVRHAK